MKFYIEHGATYDAKIIKVPFFAGAGTIKSKLEEAGFVNVHVWKNSGDWHARGTWTGESGEVELVKHIDPSCIVRVA